jgi:O-antigen/teichoic acid export membrane protein
MPFNYIATPFTSFLLSFSANLKNDTKILFANLIKFVKVFIFILYPIFLILFFLTDELFTFVFNNKWDSSIPIFRLFLFFYFINISMFFPLSGLATAYGRPDLLTKITLGRLLGLLIFLPITFYMTKSIYIYVLVYIVISLIFFLAKSIIGLKLMGISVRLFYYKLYKEVTSMLLIFLILYFMSNHNLIPKIYVLLLCIIIFFIINNKIFYLIKNLFYKNSNFKK